MDRHQEAAGGYQGVPADPHRRGAGVVRKAGHPDAEAADADDSLDHPDFESLGVEGGALFDVQFHESGVVAGRERRLGDPVRRSADPGERLAQGESSVHRQVHFFRRDFPGQRPAARLPVFFVEEHRHFEGMTERGAGNGDGGRRLEGSDGTHDSVEVPTFGDGIEVRSGKERGPRGIGSGKVSDEVACEIGTDFEPGLLEPGAETVPGCKVGVAPRGARAAALRSRTDQRNSFHAGRDAFALHPVLKGSGSASQQGGGPEGGAG